ncbi:Holliday junction resolvase RuvX [candidate division GN15 bacterium]|nr:Holliday junction resolvase RuvX [candidate division GN15 bacterium]
MSTDDRTTLALDYGRRRVGVAKSDPLGMIASSLTTLEVKSLPDAVSKALALIDEHQPTAVVLGYPLLASGDRSDMCDEVDRFEEMVAGSYDGPIYKVDEYGSSEDAASVIHRHGKRVGKDKRRVDRLAATVILQRYLDETYGG